MSTLEALALPGLSRDAEGPVFNEPWQAQAFALVVQLHAEGVVTWTDWVDALSRELAQDPTDNGSRYYDHWVAALEAMTSMQGLTTASELADCKAAWIDAYAHTPHGSPVELPVTQPRFEAITPGL